METPLTPLDFARRTRRLHGGREAVVDGDLRLSYEQFFDRCDRWSAALQGLGVQPGDRVATIAPNTHAQLASFYAVPQIGAVLVPINYRLSADDFGYIVNHSGASVLCVDRDYLDTVDEIRDQLPGVKHFVAFDAARDGWLDYAATVAATGPDFTRPEIGERDLLTINYTSGTTARPKGVMITHRNAAMNSIGTLLHLPMAVGERYLWTLPMFHANGWTYTWTVTAAAATHVCLRKVDPGTVFELIRAGAGGQPVRRPHRADLAGQRARRGARPGPARRPGGDRRGAARRGHHRAARRAVRLGGHPGLRADRDRAVHHRVRATARAREAHPGRAGGAEGPDRGRADHLGRTAGGRPRVGAEVPADGQTLGEIVVRGNVVMDGYYHDPEATQRAMGDGWFHTGDAAVVHPDGYVEIRDRIKDVIISGGENISSIEVEGTLLRHPAVQEAAIVGLPDEKWGETPHAFVVLKDGETATEAEIIAFTRDRLAHFKAPRGVTFVTALPKTATGKIQKFVLRQGAPNLGRQ